MNTVTVDSVRDHYDSLSRFYKAFWGEHIHHGYFEQDESPAIAQVKLIEQLAAQAGIKPGMRVLDVGCGLGGSSLWLARNFGCSVMGLTLSPVQVELANKRARREALDQRVTFEIRDVNHFTPPPGSYDAVWTIECSEHLFDKAQFIRRYANALRPGGVFALCAWLTGDFSNNPQDSTKIVEICEANLCPSLATMSDYVDWLKDSGLAISEKRNITDHVAKTWDYCLDLVARTEIKFLLLTLDKETRRFVKAFSWIRDAYADGSMAYGMITAVK